MIVSSKIEAILNFLPYNYTLLNSNTDDNSAYTNAKVQSNRILHFADPLLQYRIVIILRKKERFDNYCFAFRYTQFHNLVLIADILVLNHDIVGSNPKSLKQNLLLLLQGSELRNVKVPVILDDLINQIKKENLFFTRGMH